MKDGIIYPDSKGAKEVGFSSDLFSGYLWKEGQLIIISLITSKKEKQGFVKGLFDNIRNKGFDIFVPCPSVRMAHVCLAYGMEPVLMDDTEGMYFENK